MAAQWFAAASDAIADFIRGLDRAERVRPWQSAFPYLPIAAALLIGVSLWLGLRETRAPGADDPEALVERVTEELPAAESHAGIAIAATTDWEQLNPCWKLRIAPSVLLMDASSRSLSLRGCEEASLWHSGETPALSGFPRGGAISLRPSPRTRAS